MSAALVVAGVVVLASACLACSSCRGRWPACTTCPVATLGPCWSLPASSCDEGASMIGVKAVLVGAFLVATSPVLCHATARAIHTRRGDGA